MKKIYISLILTLSLFFSNDCYCQWTTIATDASGDGWNGTLLDGTMLEYQYDSGQDYITFRITNVNVSATHASAFGVNIMVNYPSGGGSTFNFWGSSNTNPFHRLLTCWVTGSPPSNYSGTIGIANSTGVQGGNYTNLHQNNLDVTVSTSNNTIIIGLDRADLIPNADLGQNVLVAAAVGSNQYWNDDIYSASGYVNIPSSNIPVTSITVAGQGGASTISTPGGTLQMLATVLPANATDNTVTWSVNNQSGQASISSSGVLTAIADGTVEVVATANDGSGVTGSAIITISNQTAGFFENNSIEIINVCPNPVSAFFSITNSDDLNATKLIIYNAKGQLMRTENKMKDIDISDFPEGLYFIEVLNQSQKTIAQCKLVKV